MMTAMLAARNILAGTKKFDLWAVNEDGEYHEAGRVGEQTAADFPRVATSAAGT
jgi:hypothetical protein